jgi:SAM-dependent methyltransferase
MRSPTTRRRRKSVPPAERPDRHRLYERAVQDAPSEVDLVERVLRRHGRSPLRLREDFSGTALVSAEWVRRGAARSAVAVDLDPKVHRWAAGHRLPELGEAARRLRLVTADVRDRNGTGYDAVVAFNFSYSIFKRREELLGYLRRARAALAPGGVLLLDAYGGWDAQKVLVERRRIRGGVTYVWDQESFDPVTHHLRCAIHFEGPGRRRLRRAFTYDWRLWTLPELTELLAEAGLEAVEVLWDVAPPGATRYVPRRSAENQPGWLAYVVGRRPARRLSGPARGASPRTRAGRGRGGTRR